MRSAPLRFPFLALFVIVACGGGATGPGGDPGDGGGDDVPATDPSVLFVIQVPASTPPGAAVHVSGNHARLGAWDGRGIAAAPREGRYVAVASFPPGTALEFKATRGSWDTVEKGPNGEEIANRRHVVAGVDTVFVEVAAWRDRIEDERPSTLSGDIRVHRAVASAYLEAARDVLVYLPPGYETDPARRYPVLYMHDGQNVFDEKTSFLGIEWEVDESAQRLIAAGEIEPLIVVAVANTDRRIDEYTPVRDPARGAGGRAADYGRFLVEELKPFIDATYRTEPGAESTGLAGSSLGGLVTLYLGLSYPDTFRRLGVVSPSIWWADKDILARVAASPKVPARIWLDMGTAEGSSPQSILAGARELRDALVAKGWMLGGDLRYTEAAGAAHNEAAWAARVPDILRYLFPPAER